MIDTSKSRVQPFFDRAGVIGRRRIGEDRLRGRGGYFQRLCALFAAGFDFMPRTKTIMLRTGGPRVAFGPDNQNENKQQSGRRNSQQGPLESMAPTILPHG